ncbi:hypothetical protein NL676_020833 [Syzygium grande]|nr:hypothetical protein NL676_020833 [Syzygium grande]
MSISITVNHRLARSGQRPGSASRMEYGNLDAKDLMNGTSMKHAEDLVLLRQMLDLAGKLTENETRLAFGSHRILCRASTI